MLRKLLKYYGSDDSIDEKKTTKKTTEITCLFLDIGGVLLTDGWGHVSRKLATKAFNLNPEEFESWHNQAFDTYELDKLTIEEYLSRVVFYEERPFTPAQFVNSCSPSRRVCSLIEFPSQGSFSSRKNQCQNVIETSNFCRHFEY